MSTIRRLTGQVHEYDHTGGEMSTVAQHGEIMHKAIRASQQQADGLNKPTSSIVQLRELNVD